MKFKHRIVKRRDTVWYRAFLCSDFLGEKQRKRIEVIFSIPSLSRNCVTVMHLGCSISKHRKSLSPVRIISTSDTIAAFRIG